MSISDAWELFGLGNGVTSKEQLEERARNVLHIKGDQIVCLIFYGVEILEEDDRPVISSDDFGKAIEGRKDFEEYEIQYIINAFKPRQKKDGTISPKHVVVTTSKSLIIPPRSSKGGGGTGNYRISERAKEIGDWAEKVVMRYIENSVAGSRNCVHRPTLGETPGWDIDYIDDTGELQRVEVKGTTGAAFTGVEMTANELDAARKYLSKLLAILGRGMSYAGPQSLGQMRIPMGMIKSGVWSAKPQLFSLRFS